MFGNEESDPLMMNQNDYHFVVMTSIMIIMIAVVHFFKFHEQSEKHRDTVISHRAHQPFESDQI